MKQFIITVLCLLFTFSAIQAQNKIIERSAKKVPEWLKNNTDGQIVVTVTAMSLSEAQTKAMTEVTERIILSVASHVSVTQKSEESETIVNDEVDSHDSFERISKLQSANLPFLKGISPNKVLAFYWEHKRDKATGKETYDYSVLYPYSLEEQRTLQNEFEKLDAEKVAELQGFETGIDQITDVNEIKQAMSKLDALKTFFIDDVRQKEVEGVKKTYKQLYDAISIKGEFVNANTYHCQLLLRGKPVTCTKLPIVKSECASQINVIPANGGFNIHFDTTDCLPEEENTIQITFRIEGKKLEHKAYIKNGNNAQ